MSFYFKGGLNIGIGVCKFNVLQILIDYNNIEVFKTASTMTRLNLLKNSEFAYA